MLYHYNSRDGHVVTLPEDFFLPSDFSGPTYPVTLRCRLNRTQLAALVKLAESGPGMYRLYRVLSEGLSPEAEPITDDTRFSLTDRGREELGRWVDEQA